MNHVKVALAVSLLVSCHRHASGPRAYVSNEDGNDISVIDCASDAVIATIPVGMRPRGLRLGPDKKTLFVALSGSPKGGPGVDESKLPPAKREADGIGVVDLEKMKLVRTLQSGQDPEAFDVSADGKSIVVSNEETAEASVIDVATGKVTKAIPVGEEPEGVTIRPLAGEAYVACEAGNAISIIDVRTNTVTKTIGATGRPRAIAFTPDGTCAFVTAENGGVVHVIDANRQAADGDVLLDRAGAPTPPRPMGMRMSPDGKTLYVTNGRAGTVSVIDVASRKVTRTIRDVGARPWGIDGTADGTKLYVANGSSNDVAVIDTATGAVVRRIPVGKSPWGVVVSR